MRRTIAGQNGALEALLLALIAGGHVLLEGPPGIGKTLACRALARALQGSFKRVAFTPDLLPSDVTGYRIFDQREKAFRTVLGPVFANVVLADEVNRAPPKVQSALLQAMEESAVTIPPETHELPQPCVVLATMNPFDQEGTYALPAAQLDRFLLKARLSMPARDDERALLLRRRNGEPDIPCGVVSLENVLEWRERTRAVYVDEAIVEYILDIVMATRDAARNRYAQILAHGASPRATLGLSRAACAKAVLNGRDFVLPDDVHAVAPLVLCHRIVLTQRAALSEIDPETVAAEILASVAAP